MRRRKDERVRSSAGQVGSHGVRKSRLASRKASPFGVVGHLRHPQRDAIARDRGHWLGQADGPKECHRDHRDGGHTDEKNARCLNRRRAVMKLMPPGGRDCRQSWRHFQARAQDRARRRRVGHARSVHGQRRGRLRPSRLQFSPQARTSGHRAAPMEELPRELLGARAGAPSAISNPAFICAFARATSASLMRFGRAH